MNLGLITTHTLKIDTFDYPEPTTLLTFPRGASACVVESDDRYDIVLTHDAAPIRIQRDGVRAERLAETLLRDYNHLREQLAIWERRPLQAGEWIKAGLTKYRVTGEQFAGRYLALPWGAGRAAAFYAAQVTRCAAPSERECYAHAHAQNYAELAHMLAHGALPITRAAYVCDLPDDGDTTPAPRESVPYGAFPDGTCARCGGCGDDPDDAIGASCPQCDGTGTATAWRESDLDRRRGEYFERAAPCLKTVTVL